MFDFVYFLKRWGITIVVLGIVYPIFFYFTEFSKGAASATQTHELAMTISISLGIALTGVIVMLASESLKRKSTRALSMVTLVGVFNLVNGLLLIYAYPTNAIAYLLCIVGSVLIVQHFRIKHKLRTLA